MLGTLWVPLHGSSLKFYQHALEPQLATNRYAHKLAFSPLRSRILAVLARAHREERMLVGWSYHELRVVQSYCPAEAEAFQEIYRDARIEARRWRSRLHPELSVYSPEWGPNHSLIKYEKFLGIQRPADLGEKKMAAALRSLRSAARRYGSLDEAPESTVRHLDHLMEHNKYDCRNTREIALRVLAELIHS